MISTVDNRESALQMTDSVALEKVLTDSIRTAEPVLWPVSGESSLLFIIYVK